LTKRPHKPKNPDVEFTAAVKAKELRFDEVPDTEVHPPAQTERENLPEKVRQEHAGITFSDVSIKVRIADELTVGESDRREEPEEREIDGSIRGRGADKPGHAVDLSKEITGKEKK
jgi:hypothetical protein